MDPLPSPGRRFEGVGEILGFMNHFVIAELHDAYRVRGLSFVEDGVLGDPEVAIADNSLNFEAGWFSGMMAAQRLEVFSAEDSLA